MTKFRPFLAMLLTLSLATSQVFAASSYEHELRQIPTHPNEPTRLDRKSPEEIPHCERFFVYRGKRLECDSNSGHDADRLRPILKEVPDAIAELDTYQENQDRIKVAAYLGTAGVLIILAGILISRPPFHPKTGEIQPGGWGVIGGAGLAVGSFVYALGMVKTNESHIGTAIENYNKERPTDPVRLEFSTGIQF
jgi:hypothetical protein